MSHDYLWDPAEPPDPRVQELEDVLSLYRHRHTPLTVPDAYGTDGDDGLEDSRHRPPWRWIAVAFAAGVMLAVAVGQAFAPAVERVEVPVAAPPRAVPQPSVPVAAPVSPPPQRTVPVLVPLPIPYQEPASTLETILSETDGDGEEEPVRPRKARRRRGRTPDLKNPFVEPRPPPAPRVKKRKDWDIDDSALPPGDRERARAGRGPEDALLPGF